MSPHPAADLEPVRAGRHLHLIEDEQVRPASGEALQRRRTVARPLDVVPRPVQVADDDLGDRRIVVDDEDVAAFGTGTGVSTWA